MLSQSHCHCESLCNISHFYKINLLFFIYFNILVLLPRFFFTMCSIKFKMYLKTKPDHKIWGRSINKETGSVHMHIFFHFIFFSSDLIRGRRQGNAETLQVVLNYVKKKTNRRILNILWNHHTKTNPFGNQQTFVLIYVCETWQIRLNILYTLVANLDPFFSVCEKNNRFVYNSFIWLLPCLWE